MAVFRMAGRAAALAVVRLTMRFAVGFADDFATGLVTERLLTLTVRLAAGLAMERVAALAVVRLVVRFAAGLAADLTVRLVVRLLVVRLAAGLAMERVVALAVVRFAAGLVAALADALAAGLAGCILVSFSICLPISLRVRLLSVFLACGMSFDSSNLRCWRRFSISTWTLALKRASCGRILDSSPSMRLAICCCSTACRTISRPRRLSFACIGG